MSASRWRPKVTTVEGWEWDGTAETFAELCAAGAPVSIDHGPLILEAGSSFGSRRTPVPVPVGYMVARSGWSDGWHVFSPSDPGWEEVPADDPGTGGLLGQLARWNRTRPGAWYEFLAERVEAYMDAVADGDVGALLVAASDMAEGGPLAVKVAETVGATIREAEARLSAVRDALLGPA